MSVIGRLDDQVDAVLIKPLTKEHETDPELFEDVKPQVPGDTAPAKDKSFDETSVLPVWLL